MEMNIFYPLCSSCPRRFLFGERLCVITIAFALSLLHIFKTQSNNSYAECNPACICHDNYHIINMYAIGQPQ